MENNYSVEAFFSRKPEERSLFDALSQRIFEHFPDVSIKVQKSQIAFCCARPFCWVWLPIRDGIKGRPERYLIASFGLNQEIVHTRLVGTTQPIPGRWTHHTIIGSIAEIDDELMDWIARAYHWKTDGNLPASERSKE